MGRIYKSLSRILFYSQTEYFFSTSTTCSSTPAHPQGSNAGCLLVSSLDVQHNSKVFSRRKRESPYHLATGGQLFDLEVLAVLTIEVTLLMLISDVLNKVKISAHPQCQGHTADIYTLSLPRSHSRHVQGHTGHQHLVVVMVTLSKSATSSPARLPWRHVDLINVKVTLY